MKMLAVIFLCICAQMVAFSQEQKAKIYLKSKAPRW